MHGKIRVARLTENEWSYVLAALGRVRQALLTQLGIAELDAKNPRAPR